MYGVTGKGISGTLLNGAYIFFKVTPTDNRHKRINMTLKKNEELLKGIGCIYGTNLQKKAATFCRDSLSRENFSLFYAFAVFKFHHKTIFECFCTQSGLILLGFIFRFELTCCVFVIRAILILKYVSQTHSL